MTWFLDGPASLASDQGGRWAEALPLLDQAANLAAALAFLAIPGSLLLLWARRRHVLPKSGVLPLFAVFIALRGIRHLGNFGAIDWAPDHLFAVFDAATAAVSLLVSIRIPEVVRHVLTLPPPKDYRRINDELGRRIRDKEQAHAVVLECKRQLRARIKDLEELIHNEIWLLEREEALDKLRSMLATIGDYERGS